MFKIERYKSTEYLTWREKYHPNRFLTYRKLVKGWQEMSPNDGFYDVFSFVWLPFLLFWFFIVCPYVAFTREPIFWIYIPIMIPAYYGTFVKMNRTIDRLRERIMTKQRIEFMENMSKGDK